MSTLLHTQINLAVRYARERLAKADIGYFDLTIRAEGRTQTDTDSVKIEYRISAGYDCSVKGNKLESVVTEVLRRKGWDDANAPLALTYESVGK